MSPIQKCISLSVLASVLKSFMLHPILESILIFGGTSLCVQPVASAERCVPETEKRTSQLEKEMKLKNMESWNSNSDDDIVTVPTANGGIRRKHHRPWTLSEVVKLVDGVAKYGAGRWSEIKRLAFASYSYRTSVDLKVSC